MNIWKRIRDRLQRTRFAPLLRLKALLAWILLVANPLWRIVEKAADIEFLVTTAVPLLRDWGWLIGILWLTVLVIRGESDQKDEPSNAQKLELAQIHVDTLKRNAAIKEEEHREELKRKEAEHRAALIRIEDLQAQFETARAHLLERIYHTKVPTFDPLPSIDHALLTSAMERLAPCIAAAADGAYDVARALGESLSQSGNERAESALAEFVWQDPILTTRRTKDRFLEFLHDKADVRGCLIAFYDRYNALRQWIPRLARYAGKDLSTLEEYRRWLPHDRRFFEELDRELAINQMAEVRKARTYLHSEHHYPEQLPE